MARTVEVIESARALDAFRADWDALAVAAGRPYCAPDWALAWWEHLRPEGALLRAVVVVDDGRLVGIAPFHAVDRRYALLAGGLSSNVEPLAAAGEEQSVAEAIATALKSAQPRPRTIDLHLQGDAPDWPALLTAAWPGGRRPWRASEQPKAAPVVTIDGLDFETWLQSKSSKFRYWVRQGRRKLEAAGAEFKLTTEQTLEADVAELVRLHHSRRAEIGSDLVADGGIERMLVAAGRELLPQKRFRLVSIEIEGRTAAAQLMITAGGEAAGWNGGFDEAFGKLSPSMHAVIHGLIVSMEEGDRWADMGPGDQPYKYRLADDERTLTSSILVPHGPGYARTRLAMAGRAAPAAVGRRLPAPIQQRIRGRLGREDR